MRIVSAAAADATSETLAKAAAATRFFTSLLPQTCCYGGNLTSSRFRPDP
jgi:hypothetical protein